MKMNCREIEKYIYLFEELAPEDQQKVEDHLKECPSCNEIRKELLNIRKMVDSIRNDTVFYNHKKETEKILYAIDQSSGKSEKSLFRISQKPLFRVAAMLIILFQAGLFLYQQNYISNSLNEFENKKKNEKMVGQTGDECIEKIETLISNTYREEDPALYKKTIQILNKLKYENNKKYSKQICEYSALIENTKGIEEKKKIIYCILSTDFNINEL